MNRRIAVRGIFVKDGKVLCVKLKPYKEKITVDFWCTVGGTVDEGESFIAALEREVLEETGVMPTIGGLLFVQQYLHKEVENIEMFFNIINVTDFENIDLAKTTHGLEEIADIDFIDASKETILPKFLSEIDFANFDPNSPTKFFSYL